MLVRSRRSGRDPVGAGCRARRDRRGGPRRPCDRRRASTCRSLRASQRSSRASGGARPGARAPSSATRTRSRLRHRAGARSSPSSSSATPRRCTPCSTAWTVARHRHRALRRAREGCAVPRLDHGLDHQRRHRRARPARSRSSWRPIRVNAIHPGIVGDSPVLGGQARRRARRLQVAHAREASSRRWPTRRGDDVPARRLAGLGREPDVDRGWRLT